jgi:multiple sugar transport system ATP-binding protein
MAEIRIESVTKVYPDGTRAVDDVSLTAPDGALLVLVGPSGCGKTTLLRMVAGLEDVTRGAIHLGERLINEIPAKERDIAMIFQNYALYPHMSVYNNMAFSLKLKRRPKKQIDERVRTTARTLGLDQLLNKHPKHLSGGQRQRVAMGRAIVREPRAFLMDEPLSNLDAKLRVQMRAEIGRLQRKLGVTTMYVTHDQTEAMTLGDLVAVMRLGVIQQVDSPQALFRRPANLFVAGFIGSPSMNLIEATLIADGGALFVAFWASRLRIEAGAVANRPDLVRYVGSKLIIGIRPDNMEDAALAVGDPSGRIIRSTVDFREEMGSESYIHFEIDAIPVVTEDVRELAADTDTATLDTLEADLRSRKTHLIARVNSRTRAHEQDPVEIVVDTSELHFFDPTSGEAIYGMPANAREAVAGRATT